MIRVNLTMSATIRPCIYKCKCLKVITCYDHHAVMLNLTALWCRQASKNSQRNQPTLKEIGRRGIPQAPAPPLCANGTRASPIHYSPHPIPYFRPHPRCFFPTPFLSGSLPFFYRKSSREPLPSGGYSVYTDSLCYLT